VPENSTKCALETSRRRNDYTSRDAASMREVSGTSGGTRVSPGGCPPDLAPSHPPLLLCPSSAYKHASLPRSLSHRTRPINMAGLVRCARSSLVSRALARGLATPSPSNVASTSQTAFSQKLAAGPSFDEFVSGADADAAERVVLGNTSAFVSLFVHTGLLTKRLHTDRACLPS
jgi:hypothetical protein